MFKTAHLPSLEPQISSGPSTVHVTLRGLNGHDPLVRELDLTVDSAFPIGRASKSGSKQNLLPAVHNAYIDSAVISRKHAILTARSANGTPGVFLTDRGSMHGTLVNGKSLESNVPCELHSGDIVQLGMDVNRNEEFHKARQYMFESWPNSASSLFSHGFSVPDDDSEDEENGPSIHSEPYVPSVTSYNSARRGSQNDPLIIDSTSSEDGDTPELQAGVPDTKEADTGLVDDRSVNLQIETTASSIQIPSSTQVFPETLMCTSTFTKYIDDHVSSDDDVYEGDAPEPEASSDNLDDISASEKEEYDDETEELPQINDYVDLDLEASSIASKPNSQAPPADIPHYLFSPDQAFEAVPSTFERLQQRYDELAGAASFDPRSPQALQSLFAPENFQHEQPAPPATWNAETMRDNCEPSPLVAPIFATPTTGLSDASILVPTSAAPATEIGVVEVIETSVANATPHRRTRVSIDEIVEEQQPPTPESLHSRKRKADGPDEALTPAPALRHLTPCPEAPVTTVDQTSVTQELPLSTESPTAFLEPVTSETHSVHDLSRARPKLQPRSVRSRVRSTVAVLGYTAVGATVGAIASFAALATLPDAFFAV